MPAKRRGGRRPAERADEGAAGCRTAAARLARSAAPGALPEGDPPPRRPARCLPAARPPPAGGLACGALAALPFPAPAWVPPPRADLSQLQAVRLPQCSSFPFLSSPPPEKKKKIGRRGRYKDKLSLSRGEEAGFTHNFKLSHIPVYPLQLSCRKSFWMGNYFSCAWLTQKGERACSSHELPKKKKKYSGLLGCLLGSLPTQCPNIYTYQFHTKDHHIVHSSRKQLSISLGV